MNELIERCAKAACEQYGNEWGETTDDATGMRAADCVLPDKRDWRAIVEAVLAETWRPIVEAPQDGSRVFVAYRHKGAWVYRVARCDELGRWLTEPGTWHISPTHYMEPHSPANTVSTQETP